MVERGQMIVLFGVFGFCYYVFVYVGLFSSVSSFYIRESPPQFENQIMARVYVRSIMRSTMYQKAPFC